MVQTWFEYVIAKPAGEIQRGFGLPAPLARRLQKGLPVKLSPKTRNKMRAAYRRENHAKLRASGVSVRESKKANGMSPANINQYTIVYAEVVKALAIGNKTTEENILKGLERSRWGGRDPIENLRDMQNYLAARTASGWLPTLAPQGKKWNLNQKITLEKWFHKYFLPIIEKSWLKGVNIDRDDLKAYIRQNEKTIIKPLVEDFIRSPEFTLYPRDMRRGLAENKAYLTLEKGYKFLDDLNDLNLKKIETYLIEKHTGKS
jgi:hypothetical protein